jgi:hypothetical protein
VEREYLPDNNKDYPSFSPSIFVRRERLATLGRVTNPSLLYIIV